jgi:hypothetical protein
MIQPTSKSALPLGLEIAPAIFRFEHQRDRLHQVQVQVSNLSNQTVVVSPRAVLCEIQPVTIEKIAPLNLEHVDMEERSHLLDKVEMSAKITEEQKKQGEQLLEKYSDIFSTGDLDIGHSTEVKHRIELTDPIPFKQRHRRIPPAMFMEVKEHLQQLLACGIIRRSHSPWASNVVLVRKKNKRTVKDSYSLPRVEEILDRLSGSKFFTVLNMKSGYHQIEMDEDHKQRTAFTCRTTRVL